MRADSMRRVALIAALLVVSPLAHAQDAADEAGTPAPEVADSITLVVRAADPQAPDPQTLNPQTLDPEELRAELERELGVHVEIVQRDDARVIVDVSSDGVVRLRVRRDERPELSRETRARPDRAQTTVAVSLIVSNLVRDESAEVLAMLRIGPERRPGAQLAEPAPAPAPEPEPEPEPEPAPAPAPATEPAPAPEPEPELAPEPEPARAPIAIDFLPAVGVSSAFLGSERRSFALGVVGALAGGIDGFSGSSVVDLALGSVNGAQIAGVLALSTGVLRGVQASGALSVAGRVEGLQLSTLASVSTGPLSGLQAATLNISGGTATGGQLGVANIAAGRVEGAQLGVGNLATEGVEGLQIGVANVAAGATRGAQLGLANIAAGDVEGAQVGLLNIASGRVSGLQLGLVNVSERADAAIGLVSVHARGRTHLRIGGDTNGILGAQLVHGGGVTHSILSIGVEPFLASPAGVFGLGFGARAEVSELLHIDVEMLGHVIIDETIDQRSPDGLVEARVLAGIIPTDGFTVYVGLGYRLHLSQSTTPELGSPVLEHVISDDPDLLVRGWPVGLLGVELF